MNVFNPTRISLGGLYARIFPYVNEAVLRELDSRAMPAPRAMVELTTALLGANTLLLGAAELALAPTLYGPTIVPLRDVPFGSIPTDGVLDGHPASANPY